MDPIAHLTLATAAFLLTHFIASTPLRGRLVARLGERWYFAAYSIVALATLVWMVVAYGRAPRELLWLGWRHLPVLVMPFSLILLVAALLSRNPTAVGQERQLEAAEPARGIVRVTRHPLMWAIALWAAAHVLARGDVKALIFFGGLLLLALVGTALIDRRRTAHGEAWRRFATATSNVPFVAIAQGRNRFVLSEIGYRNIALALVLYVALLVLHPYAFGVRPY